MKNEKTTEKITKIFHFEVLNKFQYFFSSTTFDPIGVGVNCQPVNVNATRRIYTKVEEEKK